MDARRRVLDAVRTALGRSDGDGVAAVPHAGGQPTEAPVDEPVARFRAELEAVDGRFVDGRQDGLAAALRAVATDRAIDRACTGPGIEDAVLDDAGLHRVAPYDVLDDPSGAMGLVRAQAGVAETGSVLVAGDGAHIPSLMVEDSIIVLSARDLVPHLRDLEIPVGTRRTYILVTGPSRTADIEKRLVLGAHGPIRHTVVLVP